GRHVRREVGGEEGVERVRRHASPARLVDLADGRDGAREPAVELLERRGAVGGGLARADTEPPLARREELTTAPHATAHARADTDQPSAGPGEPELWVVRGDAPHFALRDAQVRGDRLERVGREVPFGALDGLERGQEPRPLARELRQEL